MATSVWQFVVFLAAFFLVGIPISLALLKAGRGPPQSIPYLVSLLVRRILIPCIDVAFDWISVFSYYSDGETQSATLILVILIFGSIALALVSAFAAASGHVYQHLKTVVDEGHRGIGCGCLAG